MIIFIKTIFKRLLRKKSSYTTFILIPILTTLLAFSISFSSQPPAKIGILDKNNTRISKYLINSLKQNKKYDIYTKFNENDITNHIKNKSLEAAIIIDKDFEKNISSGNFSKMNIKALANSPVTGWLEENLNYLISNLNTIGQASKGDKHIFYDILEKNNKLSYKMLEQVLTDKSQSKTVSSNTVGFLLILMLSSCGIIYSNIIMDKSNLIYNRLILTKLSKLKYITSYLFVGMTAYAIKICIIFIMLSILNISFYIPTPALILSLALFGLLASSLGVFIGCISKNHEQSIQLSNIIVMPTSMLSGCLWPISITPVYMQKIGRLLPQNWVLSIIEKLQNGQTYSQVFPYFLALFVLSVILILSASAILKTSK